MNQLVREFNKLQFIKNISFSDLINENYIENLSNNFIELTNFKFLVIDYQKSRDDNFIKSKNYITGLMKKEKGILLVDYIKNNYPNYQVIIRNDTIFDTTIDITQTKYIIEEKNENNVWFANKYIDNIQKSNILSAISESYNITDDIVQVDIIYSEWGLCFPVENVLLNFFKNKNNIIQRIITDINIVQPKISSPEALPEIKYTLDFIFQYDPLELDNYISTFTDQIYKNLYDKRYMTIYNLYQTNMLDTETENLLINHGHKLREILETAHSAQEIKDKLLYGHVQKVLSPILIPIAKPTIHNPIINPIVKPTSPNPNRLTVNKLSNIKPLISLQPLQPLNKLQAIQPTINFKPFDIPKFTFDDVFIPLSTNILYIPNLTTILSKNLEINKTIYTSDNLIFPLNEVIEKKVLDYDCDLITEDHAKNTKSGVRPYTLSKLKEIAKNHNIKVSGTSKSAYVRDLKSSLCN